MSHLFGLHPWDHDRLTVGEFEGHVAFAESWLRSQKG